jgi:hypothetical protein
MKKRWIGALITLVILMAQCVGPKKFTYSFPADMVDSNRTQAMAKSAAGYELYKVYCAECHKEKNATGIPYFTKQQIAGYSLRNPSMPKAKHEVMRKLNQDEFDKIVFFLYYLDNKKKISGKVSG